MRAADRDLLRTLLAAYGPGGQEDDVREVCCRELAPLVDELTVDPAGNVVGLLRGTGERDAPAVRVTAHMDELSMVVKRVQPDGTLRLSQLGTMYPADFGLGPLTVLGDAEQLTAVLLLGSEHTTQETPQVWPTKPDAGDRAMQWSDVYAFTGRTAEDLDAAGVHPGTRVCVHHSRRTLVELGEFVASSFLDDRAALTVLVSAACLLREGERRPPADTCLVCTTGEEMGGIGAAYASRTLPGDLALGRELGLDPRAAVRESYDSDAGQAKSSGQVARAALLSLPTLSTHGYEVQHRETVERCARLVTEFLCRPTPR